MKRKPLQCTIVFCLLFIAPTAKADPPVVVEFVDENLENSVAVAVSMPATPELWASDLLRAVSVVTDSDMPIVSLEGLEYCVNLKFLFINNFQCMSIEPIRGLSYLEKVRLDGYNRFAESESTFNDIFPLEDLVNLYYLSLRMQDIQDLAPLANLTALTELLLSQNQIHDIRALAGMTKLEILELDGNQIEDISILKFLENLKILKLSENHITDISPLNASLTLLKLNLSGNRIDDISPLENHESLTELNLSGNPISNISVISNFQNLTSLALGDDDESEPLVDISSLSYLKELQSLSLGSNHITNLDPISSLNNLSIVALGENPITDLSALLANDGIGEGDTISLGGKAITSEVLIRQLGELESRGVRIFHRGLFLDVPYDPWA